MNETTGLDGIIKSSLNIWRWDGVTVDEGRLMLTELLIKANAGCYNSHTEEGFLSVFSFLRKDRTLNKQGRRFLLNMMYKSSNKQSEFVTLSLKYRVNQNHIGSAD